MFTDLFYHLQLDARRVPVKMVGLVSISTVNVLADTRVSVKACDLMPFNIYDIIYKCYRNFIQIFKDTVPWCEAPPASFRPRLHRTF